MKTEQQIKEKLAYLKGYKAALLDYGQITDEEDIKDFAGQVKAFNWVLEVNNDNK